MKNYSALVLVRIALISVAPLLAESTTVAQKPRTVSVNELSRGSVIIIGELGVPLVRAVEIVATIEEVPWSTVILGAPHTPSDYYLLRVEEVDGKKLEKPKSFVFDLCQAWNVSVAPNKDALDKLLQELTAEANGSDIQQAFNRGGKYFYPAIRSQTEAMTYKQNYVGSRHRLVVYEAAIQDGIPVNLPPEVGPWQLPWTVRFPTSLRLLSERKL